ncbi:MAG: phosphotransferase [Clostridia bacterium]|nr:phosphotransferase [Clostridia bacterium]
MKTMEELTRLGRIRRCRSYMIEALESYAIEVKKISFLTEATNVFYKVVDQNDEVYVMKLYEELSSNLEDSLVEINFLELVKEKTDIHVPEVVKNRYHEKITILEKAHEKYPKRVVVYKWLPGKDYEGNESLDYFKQIGKVMGTLHELTEHYVVPDHLHPKKINQVFYYAGDAPFYLKEKHKSFVTPRYKQVMETLKPILDHGLNQMYENKTPIMIHGDFNPYNIRVKENQVYLLDFEDASLAFPVHDIAILFYYYRFDEKYLDYQKAFYEGYKSIKPDYIVQEETIEMIMAARDLNFLNYILEISDDPMDYIERNLNRLEAYMQKRKIGY